MKKLLIVLGALTAAVLLIGTVAAVMIDPLVRKTVEKESAAALQVPTRLHDASVRFSGKVALKRFEIHNPPDYSEPRAVTFERFDLLVRPRELFEEEVEIDDVTVVRPELTLEFNGAKNNLSALLDNLNAGRAPREPKEDGKKFLIRRLHLQNAVVRFRSNLLSGGARTVSLPDISLENIGTAEGGATMGEILKVLLQTLGTAALNSAQGLVPSELLNSLRADLEGRVRELPAQVLDELKHELERKLGNPFERKTAD